MRAGDILQFRFNACEFVGQDRFEEVKLSRKMRVERLLANPELVREIIHGHAAEAVAEKVCACSVDDALPIGFTLSILQSRFV